MSHAVLSVRSLAQILVLSAALFSVLAAPHAGAANIGISPILGDIPSSRRMAVFEVRNNASTPVPVQVQAFEWRQEGGEDVRSPADDLLIAPAIVTIAPGRSQLVRVALRDSDRSREHAYRVLFRELPHGEIEGSGVILRTLLTLDVPLFFAPEGEARRNLDWRLQRDVSGAFLVATNTGNRFTKLQEAVVLDGNGKELATLPGPIYVLAGSTQQLPLPQHLANARELAIVYRSAGEETTVNVDTE